MEDDEEPLGLLDDDDPPPLPDDEPDIPPPDEDVPPVPPGLVVLELDDPGELGAVDVVDEDDEPPGTTTVSFSFVVVELVELEPLGAAPPGTTVVVSLRSQAASARAPIRTSK